MSQPTVPRSEEWRRIVGLPVRTWQEAPDLPLLIERLSYHLATPEGRAKGVKLRPQQAAAIRDLYDWHRLMAPIPVGGGKTLISFLAPAMFQAKRPALILPGGLVQKTQRELAKESRNWKVCAHLRIMSADRLPRKSGQDELDALAPDMILIDEAHGFKSPSSARTRVLKKYLKSRPDTIVIPMSGTFYVRDVDEYWHLSRWALRDACPLPLEMRQFQMWQQALSQSTPEHLRWSPGALLDLADGGQEGTELERARRAYGRRLTTIPGVIHCPDDGAPFSLEIKLVQPPVPPAVVEALDHLRTTWTTPDGHPFEGAMELWRHSRTLACGFWTVWDPPAPEAWLAARREISSHVNYILAHNRRDLFSPLAVWGAIEHGFYPEAERALKTWKAIRGTFRPNPVAHWAGRDVIEWAAAWLREPRNKRGLLWVDHIPLGREISALAKVPYFGPKGLDSRGVYVEDHDGPAIVSARANRTGRNLQHKWSSNLILTCIQKADVLQQLLGRTHRQGQTEDLVSVEWVCSTQEDRNGIERTVAEARGIVDKMRDSQKIVDATWLNGYADLELV